MFQILISAGILKRVKVTGVYRIKDDIINAGAIFIDTEVVYDNNIISSRGPDDLPTFCRKLSQIFSEKNI